MERKTASQLLVSVIVSHAMFLALVTAAPTQSNAEKGSELAAIMNGSNYPLTLNFLGVVEGKAYFAEVNMTMNWTAAKTYCEASSLELASIETVAQLEFLNRTILDGDHFWTSGHESRKPAMMEWDQSEIAINATVLPRWEWYYPDAYLYCGAYVKLTSYDMHAHPCDSDMFVLCQAMVASLT